MAGIAAKSYCDALFEIAKEEAKLERYKEQLCMVTETFVSDEKFKAVMNHPKISKEKKKELLCAIYQSSIDSLLMNFLKLLVDKGRFMLLHDITKEFVKSYNIEHNIQVVYVKSAARLSTQQIDKLQQTLEQKLDKQVDLVFSIDEELIAGIRVKINDQIIDNSVLSRLTRLKKSVHASEA